MATFESALPAAAVLTLTKGTTDTGVKAVIDETRKTATFTAASKYAVGTYTVTATAGESKQSKDVEIKEQSVQDIVIKSKQALTNNKKDTLYVYYDVIDQYGESMRSATSVTWTSGSGTVKADKSTGCLTIKKNTDDKTQFTYGTNIYLVGVDVKSGKSVQATLPVGMVRALDTVKFEGFVNSDDKGTILETLPKDFAVGKYSLLFTAYDQDGNEMEADKSFTDSTKPKVTFIADNPTLIKTEFKQGDIYTIKGRKYCSVKVEPGMYVDKGGEVNITAISNTTGNRTTKNFVIGAGAILKSLSLSAPTETIADGDQNVNIPFVAKDTEGKDVTNYETIVRSTNQLKLTTSAGKLTVYETESGTAAIKWDDSESAENFKTSSSRDGVDRPVSLVTTVIGGESSNIMMYVSDTRRPVAVSSVKLNNDNNDIITENNKVAVDFFSGDVKYIDQYGKVLDEWNNGRAEAFFKQAATGFNGHKYGVKVDYSAVDTIDASGIAGSGTNNAESKFTVLTNENLKNVLTINTKELGKDAKNAITENIRYSIVKLENSEWDTVDAENSIDYTVVPVGKLSNLRINDIAKLRLETDFSLYENGSGIVTASAVALNDKGDVADVATQRDVVVAGSYDGKTVTVPNTFYDVSDNVNTTFKVENNKDGKNAKITGLLGTTTGSAIKYSDLYDFNTAENIRKDARKDVAANVYKVANSTNKEDLAGTVKTSVSVSDALRYPTKIAFHQYNAVASKIDIAPNNTVFDFATGIKKLSNSWESNWNPAAILVTDQYGDGIKIADPAGTQANDEVRVEFSVSNIVENAGEFAHLPKSFTVNRNNSDTAALDKIEIKDTFDLTATVAGTGVSTKVSATVVADELAYISSAADGDKDSTLRKTLGYNR